MRLIIGILFLANCLILSFEIIGLINLFGLLALVLAIGVWLIKKYAS
jgi:hypothetical protein